MKSISIHPFTFVKAYIVTMRPYLFFVSGISGAAGMAFGTIEDIALLFPLFLAFFLSYGFGQALTDCTQIDTDRLSSPYRPLVQGVIQINDVYKVSLVGLAICGLIFTLYSPYCLLLSIFAIAGLSTYTYFKKLWWAGPFYNAWIVLVVGIMGSLSTGGFHPSFPFFMTMAAIFFGYANFVASGYFKDVEADRATGYNTIVVKYGRRFASWVCLGFGLLSTIPTFLVIHYQPSFISYLIFVYGTILAGLAQYFLFNNHDDKEAYLPIALGVHGYIVHLIAICAAMKPMWLPFLGMFYLLFCLTMKFRPSKDQI